MEKYRTTDKSEVRNIWYYYTSLDKKNRESISVWNDPAGISYWYWNMWMEKLLSGDNWNWVRISWWWTNMPFWRRHDIENWCYWWKKYCREEWWKNWGSLWIR